MKFVGAHETFVPETGPTEIKQQGGIFTGDFQIIQHLSPFNNGQLLKRLDLYKNSIKAQKVDTKTASQNRLFIGDRQWRFAQARYVTQQKSAANASL